ncbi:MAG: type transport system ATP-binding protein [Actinomycetota bacterium]|jgi:ABC-2 type transport system ATP-binding protein|nr:type transport system ATP-binding protein [Actinomycetota bacterium]
MSAVEARGLGKRYRKNWALRDCTFTLPANRVIALVGANGAGKSTLMAIASGLLAQTEGEILIGGLPPGTYRRQGDESVRVVLLAQDKPLYRSFTVADMLNFGRHLNRIWDQQRALSWLDRFDIPLDRPCGKLSGGQQAQVALAVALGARPALLLLDEPLANLDPVARHEVMGEILAEVAEAEMTVMLSTHVVAELGGVGDYLLLLAHGRPVLDGDTEELLADHVRLTGPKARTPPGQGAVVHAQHAERQSTFIVRLPQGPALPIVAPGWRVESITMEDLILAYLKTSRAAASTTQHESLEAIS